MSDQELNLILLTLIAVFNIVNVITLCIYHGKIIEKFNHFQIVKIVKDENKK